MKRREFGEPIKMYLVEEDRLQQLLMIEHKYMCVSLGFDNDRFEYFWDMMVEAGCDQHVSHKEFVEAVENMTFEKLAEMDLALYTEHVPSDEVVYASWTGMDGDQCSHCGRSLRDLMDADSYYSSEFESAGFEQLKACPFCGARMKK
jgi:hypothetical protein